MFNPVTRVSEKCIGCFPKLEQGLQPQCFVHVHRQIRLKGYLSTPDESTSRTRSTTSSTCARSPSRLSAARPRAERLLHPPGPRSDQYLTQMFGPGVERQSRPTAMRRTIPTSGPAHALRRDGGSATWEVSDGVARASTRTARRSSPSRYANRPFTRPSSSTEVAEAGDRIPSQHVRNSWRERVTRKDALVYGEPRWAASSPEARRSWPSRCGGRLRRHRRSVGVPIVAPFVQGELR